MSHCRKKSIFLLLSFNALLSFCYCFEPISTVSALGSAALALGYASYHFMNCKFNECCTEKWIDFNYDGLKNDLKNSLFGQHLASEVVLKTLQNFLKDKNPKKPLVLSFHGTPGVGKSYVTQKIANNLYKNSTYSKFYHYYHANFHFPHPEEVPKYKDLLRRDIMDYTKLCDRSLFVFDEVHQMPPGILDAIKPFLDYCDTIDGVDFRKNIFIFLSNAGGSAIEEVVLNAWLAGKDRETITMKDIESEISLESLNEKGGFQHSQILQSELIDVYVPFFPLEKKHVKKCIIAELKKENVRYSKKLVDDIANEMVYYPDSTEIFSKSGCKRIYQKVMQHI